MGPRSIQRLPKRWSAIHADQIKPLWRSGRSTRFRFAGIRAVPATVRVYYANLIEEAAALWESLAQNHPFIDGNKRTAFAVTWTFLHINHVTVTASAAETFAFISERHAASTFHFRHLTTWLRANIRAEPE